MPQYDDVDEKRQYQGRTKSEGPPEGPEPMTTMTTSVPMAMHRQLKIASVHHGMSIKEIVGRALQSWLDQHPV